MRSLPVASCSSKKPGTLDNSWVLHVAIDDVHDATGHHRSPSLNRNPKADREVREYREKIRERRQQQQQQQHKATSIARYASSSSPADSDHDFETEHSALRAGKPSARGDSDGEDLAKAEMESDSGAASGVGGGEGSGLSVGRSVNSVSGGSDSDWF